MMKPIDYQYWFKFDFWTFKQAAYLICNINPDDKNHIQHISHEKFKRANPNLFGSVETCDKYFKLLNGTQFSSDLDKEAPTGSASVASIIKFAKDNNVWGFPSHLKSEWGKYPDKPNADSGGSSSDTSSPFRQFHDMKDLSYDQITISFLDGDFIALSALGETSSFSYESLGLRDMRKKGEANLNKAGWFLAALLSTVKPKPDPKFSKHKDTLKKLINTWFGLKGDPFLIVGDPPSTRYEARFTIKTDLDRAAKRIEKRAAHVGVDNVIDIATFDDEDDAAGEFLRNKKQRKQ